MYNVQVSRGAFEMLSLTILSSGEIFDGNHSSMANKNPGRIRLGFGDASYEDVSDTSWNRG